MRNKHNTDARAEPTSCDDSTQQEHAGNVDNKPNARGLDKIGHNLSFDPFGRLNSEGSAAARELGNRYVLMKNYCGGRARGNLMRSMMSKAREAVRTVWGVLERLRRRCGGCDDERAMATAKF